MYEVNTMHWEDNKAFLFRYYPTYSPQSNRDTSLILDFKKNQRRAVYQVQQYAKTAFAYSEIDFLDKAADWYILSIPGSQAGVPNRPCESLCAYLASQFPWIHYCQEALRRTITVPKSATARKENRSRATRFDHERSIQYVGPSIPLFSGVLLVDDILTTSSTFEACYGILKKATPCEHIFGFFIGRTQYT